ncbi:hypothetical protein AC578_5684, partial [Pseudocercospora eumusae]
ALSDPSKSLQPTQIPPTHPNPSDPSKSLRPIQIPPTYPNPSNPSKSLRPTQIPPTYLNPSANEHRYRNIAPRQMQCTCIYRAKRASKAAYWS